MKRKNRHSHIVLACLVSLTALVARTTLAQGVFYGISGDESQKEGVSFPAGPLQVDPDTKFKTPIVIEIAEAKGGLLQSTPESTVPTSMGVGSGGSLNVAYLTHGVNVTWVFKRAGLVFEADGAKYTVERSGATVQFTETGVKLDGVKKVGGMNFFSPPSPRERDVTANQPSASQFKVTRLRLLGFGVATILILGIVVAVIVKRKHV